MMRIAAAAFVIGLACPAAAQSPTPCFAITPMNAGQTLDGYILLNQCTGETWIMSRFINPDAASFTYKWSPLDYAADRKDVMPLPPNRMSAEAICKRYELNCPAQN